MMFPVAVAATDDHHALVIAGDHLRAVGIPDDELFDALSIRTPSWALPRSASPVESVPIRLPVTWFPVAAAPEIRTPWRLAEITFPGPITLLAEKMATPSPEFPRTVAPLEVRPMILFATVLPVAEVPVISTPTPRLAEIDVLLGAARAADDVVGGILDQDAVPGIPRITLAEEDATTGSRPDEVPLDQVQRRPRADDMDTVAEVARDQVPGAGRSPTNDVAGGGAPFAG